MILSYNNGFCIDGVPFVLDATRPVGFAFASHAHADHCGRHRKILATPATADLARLRYGKRDFFTLPTNQAADIDGVTVELFNSGHVLGSAQIRLTSGGRRILFTGDLKPAGGRTTPPAEIPECDILIIEATYGRPEYVFPSPAAVTEKLVLLIKRAFVRGLTPVLLVYALGKAQEVLALLGDEGFVFSCHRLIYDVIEIYRKYGIALPGAELFSGDRLGGRVVVMPPGMRRSREWKLIKNPVTIFLSGWALNHSRRSFTDAVMPLSDHADYPQLVEFTERTKPELVYTYHGFADLARALRDSGRKARHIEKRDCIDLLTGRKANPPAAYDLFGHAPR